MCFPSSPSERGGNTDDHGCESWRTFTDSLATNPAGCVSIVGDRVSLRESGARRDDYTCGSDQRSNARSLRRLPRAGGPAAQRRIAIPLPAEHLLTGHVIARRWTFSTLPEYGDGIHLWPCSLARVRTTTAFLLGGRCVTGSTFDRRHDERVFRRAFDGSGVAVRGACFFSSPVSGPMSDQRVSWRATILESRDRTGRTRLDRVV